MVDSFSKDKSKLKVLTLFNNEIVESWVDIEDMEKEYLGFAIMLKKSFNSNTSQNRTLEVESRNTGFGVP